MSSLGGGVVGDGVAGGGGRAGQPRLIQVVLSAVYASSACSDLSRPAPVALKPPKGVITSLASKVLIQTVPARSRFAVRWATVTSRVHTEATSPKSLWFASR